MPGVPSAARVGGALSRPTLSCALGFTVWPAACRLHPGFLAEEEDQKGRYGCSPGSLGWILQTALTK